MLEKWERTSGATFEASKTSFIHLTRYKESSRDSNWPLVFKGQSIRPSKEVKILGVTLDQDLRFKTHLADKAGKATRTALALRRLKGISPKCTRQLARSSVLPVADYASPVWYPLVNQEMLELLEQPQRIAAQAIIKGFRTVALSVAELEAGLTPLRERLRNQAVAFWVSIHKLSPSHPHCLLRKKRMCRRHLSPLLRLSILCKSVRVDTILEVKPYACPPWVARPEVEICKDKEEAQEIIANGQPGQTDLYVDASVRNGRAGIGICAEPSGTSKSVLVGPSFQVDTHLAELLAINEAAKWPSSGGYGSESQTGRIRIFSDSQSAVLSVRSWRASAYQKTVSETVKTMAHRNITLYWIPGHAGIDGNERANELARRATTPESGPVLDRTGKPWYLARKELKEAGVTTRPIVRPGEVFGSYSRKVDGALHLGKSAKIYEQLNSTEAAILTQLRTGKSHLNEYLANIRAVETPACECGMAETVPHFLFCCPRWIEQRAALKWAHGHRFGELSYAVGGYPTGRAGKHEDGPIEKWSPDIEAVKATIRYAKETGRLENIRDDSNDIAIDRIERRRLAAPINTN